MTETSLWQSVHFLRKACHDANRHWWKDLHTNEDLRYNKHVISEKLMLCVCELAEAMEGHRKNTNDSHLPQHKAITVELADALIRIFDLAGALGLPIATALYEKMDYNMTRKDHTLEARKAPGGKAL